MGRVLHVYQSSLAYFADCMLDIGRNSGVRLHRDAE